MSYYKNYDKNSSTPQKDQSTSNIHTYNWSEFNQRSTSQTSRKSTIVKGKNIDEEIARIQQKMDQQKKLK